MELLPGRALLPAGVPPPSCRRRLASLGGFLSFPHGIPGKRLAERPVLPLRWHECFPGQRLPSETFKSVLF